MRPAHPFSRISYAKVTIPHALAWGIICGRGLAAGRGGIAAAIAAAVVDAAIVAAAAAAQDENQDNDTAAVAAAKEAIVTHNEPPSELSDRRPVGLSSSYVSMGKG